MQLHRMPCGSSVTMTFQSQFNSRSSCRAQHGLQTVGNPDVHDQHTKTPKPGKPTLEFEVVLSLFSDLTFVNNNVGLPVHNGRLERVA